MFSVGLPGGSGVSCRWGRGALLGVLIVAAAAAIPAGGAFGQTSSSQPASQPDVEKLSDKIDQAIQLLEEKKYAELIRLLASPKFVKNQEEKGTFNQTVAEFDSRQAQNLLNALKQTRGKQPTMRENGRHAIYEISISGRTELDFELIDGKWYLK